MKIPYDKKLHLICGCILALLVGLYNPIYGLSAGALIGTCLCFMAQI